MQSFDIVTYAHVSRKNQDWLESKVIVPLWDGWFDLMALPDAHIKPTVPTPWVKVWVCMFYGYLLPKCTL